MNRKRIATIAIETLKNELCQLEKLDDIVRELDCMTIYDSDVYFAARELVEIYHKKVDKLDKDIDKAELWGNNEPTYRLNEKVRIDDYGDRITTYEIICIYDNAVMTECDTIDQAVEWIQRND